AFNGSDQALALRTSLWAKATAENGAQVMAEMLDSRHDYSDTGSPVGTGNINAFELLQGWVGFQGKSVFEDGDKGHVLLGRHTMNVGSRRLVARNRFRNTINAFTGLNATWESEEGDFVRAFYTLPVRRLPRDQASLLQDEVRADDESSNVQFFGLFGSTKNLFEDATAELYAIGIKEDDGPDLNTRNRDLWTIGARYLKAPKRAAFDMQLEAMLQIGESRASSSGADTTDLDHEASYQHLALGYTFDHDLKPRLALQIDHATGDDDPNDGSNQRFDTLFGARRFEYGPTGIYGPFARSNLFSPGLRLQLQPAKNWKVMFASRMHYLASDRDAWTTAGLIDPTGNTNRYLGNLSEVRVRWEAKPKNIRVEVGIAQLTRGDFADDAPGANDEGDATYGYLQTTFTF
ncbi:MAG: alginate export family protein, partial [Planctomycetota bacterium]